MHNYLVELNSTYQISINESKFCFCIIATHTKLFLFSSLFYEREIFYVRKIQRTRLHSRTNLKPYQIKRQTIVYNKVRNLG